MAEAVRDQNYVTSALGVSSVDGVTPILMQVDPVTGRLKTDSAGGSGTVTSVSVVSANGFAGTVATATTTPAITLSTTITGLIKGNGTAISAATAGTDYIVPTTAFTAGSVAFGGASGKLSQDNANLFWDDTNNFLGIGSGVPLTPLWIHVGSGQNFAARTTGSALQVASLADDANSYTQLRLDGNTIIMGANSGGVVGIATGTPGSALQVNGGVAIGYNASQAAPTNGLIVLGHLTLEGVTSTGATGTGKLVFDTSPVFVTPALGTPSSGTLTNATGLPIAGLVASTSTAIGVGSIELGAVSDTTIARVSAGVISVEGSTVGMLPTTQTWTGQNKFNNIVDVNNAIAASANAATVPVTFRLNTVTNNSAATLTITMTTASAVDGQMTIVRILDFSAVAQTLVFVNTENSTVSVPSTSNGSTTLPLTVGFMYNSATSKWRCIASA